MTYISRRAVLGSVAATLVSLPVRAQQAGDGFRVLEARKTSLRLMPAPAGETTCLGYDGAIPGPLLRVKQGEEVRVRLLNRLDQPTSLHWQGLRGENAMDGVGGLTQKPVAPGQSFDYRFKAADAGLTLYKPGVVAHAAQQISHGLSGVLIVEEAEPPPVDRDLLIVMQDWTLDDKGALAPASGPAPLEGRIGEKISANARPAPHSETAAPGSRLRLRLANACAARFAIVTFEGCSPRAIAIDGQPCDPFQLVRDTAPLAPGARFEFILDMPTTEGAEAKLVLWNGQGKPPLPFVTIKAEGKPVPPRGEVKGLVANKGLPPEIRLGEARKLELVIEPPKTPGAQWTINGAARGYGANPIASVKRGTPISIGFANRSTVPLAMHVHGHSMRLLHDKDDGWEPYWRNAVIVPKGATKHVALLADAPGRWAVHCDVADHEAAGLATWFEVT